jgi:thioester reductase-like protein
MAAPLTVVTGYPGFLGRRVVSALLEDPQQRVVVLVEPRMADVARAAANDLGPDGARLEVIEADVARRRLALDARTWDRLASDATAVFHLAAIYDLATPLAVAQRVNVDGTGNVIELCRAIKHLERLNYVSTAYVAGTRKGIVYEHELSLGQRFKNHYESTKFQAELWVRQAMDDLPITVSRPAIVVGDSKTGVTQKFDGPYYILRLISLVAARGVPLFGLGSPDSVFNVVPADFVVDAIMAASKEPMAEGATLHLVDPDPVSSAELTRLLAEAYAGLPVRGRLPGFIVAPALRLAFLRGMLANTPRESVRYLNHPVRFDTRQAEAVLAKAGIVPPRFQDYVGPMVKFFKEHETDVAYMPAGH